MNLNYIREFLTLADNLNFKKTAEQLYISRPALTKHIDSIETELGSQLLLRTSRGVKLTSDGRFAVEKFREMLAQYDNLQDGIKSRAHDNDCKLQIGVLYYGIEIYAYPLINILRKEFPHIKLSIVSCQPHQIVQSLDSGEIDAGILMHSRLTITNDNVAYYPIGREYMQAIVTSDHPLTKQVTCTLGDLNDQTIVVTNSDGENSAYIIMVLKYHNIAFREVIYSEQIDTVHLTLQETGGVFLGTRLLRNMAGGVLSFLDLSDEDFYYDFCLIYKKSNSNSGIQALTRCANKFKTRSGYR